ncbi:PREDICTED: sodium-independent sulfate anion transporter-like [Vollenhovia emeryi]|uniref:sodium-independent sulfate anion transporter-like n=1 Tax=Vollenhovia emeryi TaxID=411798 RepID=UPI0005F3A5D6|nr:PREDICTED: sodium-independent sulfate anion transporter-like [Vollenhovia emeryi]
MIRLRAVDAGPPKRSGVVTRGRESHESSRFGLLSLSLSYLIDARRMSDEECPPISISERKPPFTLAKYVPVLGWLPRYTRLKAVSDLIAGITVGLTMIPQSMAYAVLAERIPQYGLYSCFVGGFLYVIFGTTKEVSIGPSSLMALLTLQYTRDMPQDFVILLCFLAGCVEFLMGVLNLGFLVDFISVPVTSGFMSAGALIIIIAQLQGLLGLKHKSENIADNLYKIVQNINNARPADFTLGIFSIAFLLIFRKLENCPCAKGKRDAPGNATIKKVFWYLSIGRNALVVLITATIAYQFEAYTGSVPFRLSGKIEAGLPKVSLPPFSSQVGNQTYTFFDMCAHYGLGLGILPVISVLANVAIAKAFAMGASVNATQEMLALGLSNIIGSFVSSLPTAGAFTRSAVSSASGIQTPMAGLYSGTMALMALSFLTPYFYYIPRATLAAVLISAVLFMIDLKIIKLLWRGSKTDAIAAIGTFVLSVVIGIEIGLLLGVLFNLILFIRLSARVSLQTINCKTHLGNKYIMLKPDACLHYPAVSTFCNKVMSLAGNAVPLIVNCERFTSLDYTSIKGIETLSKRLNRDRNQFWLLHLNFDVVKSFNVLADNEYIRLIEKKESIADILYDNALSNKDSEDPLNVNVKKATEMERLSRGDLSYSNSRRKDSEVNDEELTLAPPECQIQQ